MGRPHRPSAATTGANSPRPQPHRTEPESPALSARSTRHTSFQPRSPVPRIASPSRVTTGGPKNPAGSAITRSTQGQTAPSAWAWRPCPRQGYRMRNTYRSVGAPIPRDQVQPPPVREEADLHQDDEHSCPPKHDLSRRAGAPRKCPFYGDCSINTVVNRARRGSGEAVSTSGCGSPLGLREACPWRFGP